MTITTNFWTKSRQTKHLKLTKCTHHRVAQNQQENHAHLRHYHPSAPKVGKFNQNTPEPFFDAKSPQPGDLVMGTAGDIHHPTAEYLMVSPSFVVFGIVRSYAYIK